MLMSKWWEGLSEREAALVMSAAAFAVVLIGYAVGLAPIQARLTKAEAAFRQETELLQYFHEHSYKVSKAGSVPEGRVAAERLQVVLAASAKEFNVSLSRISEDAGRVSVSVESASFGDLLRWFEHLANKGVDVSGAQFRPLERARVECRVEFLVAGF